LPIRHDPQLGAEPRKSISRVVHPNDDAANIRDSLSSTSSSVKSDTRLLLLFFRLHSRIETASFEVETGRPNPHPGGPLLSSSES
jgi:hypothetical protein